MKRFILAILGIFVSGVIFSQQLTYSPFTRYGYGELFYQGNLRGLSMGKTGIASFSEFHINKINPASYAALPRQKVVFEISGFGRISEFTTPDLIQMNNLANVRTIYGGFPVTDWWHVGFGLVPYSGMGYKIKTHDSLYLSGVGTGYDLIYQGYGSVNELFFGNTFSLKKHFHFGFNTSYVFGSLNRYTTIAINDTKTGFKSDFVQKYRTLFKGFKYEFGLMYHDTLLRKNDKYKTPLLNISLAAVGNNQELITTLNTLEIYRTIRFLNRTKVDTFSYDTLSLEKNYMPLTLGAGVNLKFFNKLELEFNYLQQKWSELSILGQNNFADSKFMAIGAEYCNQAKSTVYWKTIRFRAGAYTYTKYLTYNGYPLQEQAITLGFGMPFENALFNMAFVFGTQTSKGIDIRERFFEIHLSLSIQDFWFMKRKFM